MRRTVTVGLDIAWVTVKLTLASFVWLSITFTVMVIAGALSFASDTEPMTFTGVELWAGVKQVLQIAILPAMGGLLIWAGVRPPPPLLNLVHPQLVAMIQEKPRAQG